MCVIPPLQSQLALSIASQQSVDNRPISAIREVSVCLITPHISIVCNEINLKSTTPSSEIREREQRAMATRVESNRPIDVEMYDDSASNVGSEMSYHSSTNQRYNHLLKHNWPTHQPGTTPLDAAQFRPGGVDDLGDDNRARPGRPPARPDTELTSEELRRRNRRRQRNREAAQRCRQRRLDQIDVLKEEVRMLKDDAEDQRQENVQLKSELRKVRFQLDLYERTVGPLTQLTAQPYHRQPMLVQQAIKVESNHPQVHPLQLEQAHVQHYHHQLHQQVQPIMVPITTSAAAAATTATSTAASTLASMSTLPESTTPASISTTSPPVPTMKPLMSPYPAGLVPLISPQTGIVFAYTPTGAQGLITPFTPTLNPPEAGFFTFPSLSKSVLEKARKDSTTQFDRVASEVALATPTKTTTGTTTTQPVSNGAEDISEGNNSVNGSVKSTHDDKSSEATENK